MVRTRLVALVILAVGTAAQAAFDPTPADLTTITDRLIDGVLPKGKSGDALIDLAGRVAQTQNAEGTWADIDTKDVARSAWKLRDHLERTLVLAKTAAIGHREGHPNRVITDKAVAAIRYWIARDFKNPNWWWNDIGVPELLGESTLLLGGDAPPDVVAGVFRIMERPKWKTWTGQNLVWGVTNQITLGLIVHDARLVSEAYGRMYEEVVFTPGEGIQVDDSFHQHGVQFYSGGYGLGFAQDVSRFAAYAWGTHCQPSNHAMEVLRDYLLDGEAWMTWGSLFDYSALGREITRPGKAAVSKAWERGPIAPAGAAYGLGQSIRLLADLPVPRKQEYVDFAGRLMGSKDAAAKVGHKHFWRSDYTAHRRGDYLFSVKMFSTRIQNTELVNDEGKKSHHLGDGNTFLYRTGEEYRDIFPVWDWSKLPGTTAEQSADLDKLLPAGNRARGKTDFVGGVSDGVYGVSAMDLRRGSLAAHKSWFFFDDEIVCVGSGIESASENDVVTTAEQCFRHGQIIQSVEQGWVWHNNVGYIAEDPSKSAMKYLAKTQTGAWSELGVGPSTRITEDVFTLLIDHGVRPHDGGYAYHILPGATTAATKERVERPTTQILFRSNNVQMVRNVKAKITGAVFFNASAAGGIGVDRPCILMLCDNYLTACDPANTLTGVTLHVTLDGKSLSITLPGGEMAGSSVTVQVR